MLTKYSAITREERYFTSYLFHDIENNLSAFEKLLSQRLEKTLTIKEVVFEAAFIRDMVFASPYRKELRERIGKNQKSFGKITFDLLLVLENNDMIIIEAKAACYFSNKQFDKNFKIIDFIKDNYLELGFGNKPIITQIGLHSNQYQPRHLKCDIKTITWDEIATIYPQHKIIYQRANTIFKEKTRQF